MRGAAAAAALALVAAGCSTSPEDGDVVVLAASSLAGVAQQVATEYEHDHPGVHVRVTSGGSSELVSQLSAGLAADVLLTADERTMRAAVDDGLVTAPATVSTNTLTLVTAPGNPLHLTGLADAGRHTLVVCAPPVPCGAATRRLAALAHVALTPRSEEQNVTAVLEKVTSRQADAGVVYATDARRAGSAVAAVPLAGADDVVTRQSAAATTRASAHGREVLALLTGSRGQALLAQAGFGPR